MIKINKLLFSGICILLVINFIFAVPPSWVGSSSNYSVLEDSNYYHDLRNNITGYNLDVIFAIDSETDIVWKNATASYNVTPGMVSSWINIPDSNIGNLTITPHYDNQSGFFELPIQGTNTTDSEAAVTIFEFILNATNDFPSIINSESQYNLTQGEQFFEFVNATDEENHYPLTFNMTFLDNCTFAAWSNRTPGDCQLFNISNYNNNSGLMNFTPTYNDVGVYYANLSVSDSGKNYACGSGYCSSDYSENKTTHYSQLFVLNLLSILDINASDCQDKIFQEGEIGQCNITIRTRSSDSEISISSDADLRNYNGDVFNPSWFYSNQTVNSANYTYNASISVNPGETEIGNWTINFSVYDLLTLQSDFEFIYVYVNRTTNGQPDLSPVEDLNVSMDIESTISLEVFDDDLLIPDKNETFGGYNEIVTFNRTILNQSDLGQELDLSGFDIEILEMPVLGTNRATARIVFTPNSGEVGNYTINITATDKEGAVDYELFNLSILRNYAPLYNNTANYTFNLTVNSTLATTSPFYLNLSNGYFYDEDGDSLNFTNITGNMTYFSLASNGIINFTPYKEDVGVYSIIIRATDTLGLFNQTTFTFNISNVNSNPYASKSINPSNVYEGNETIIDLLIYDDEVKIRNKSVYNETFSIHTTINGPNTNLFSFSLGSGFPNPTFPNITKYTATFTPTKADANYTFGLYQISVNITDLANASYVLNFNFTINATQHCPILDNLSNLTSVVNQTLVYQLNATDQEDGNSNESWNTNFTFSYSFLNDGKTPGFLNASTFNSTKGFINATFNSTQGGSYHLNITVNDTTNRRDYGDFWIKVYDVPIINYPATDYIFDLKENVSESIVFNANDSVGDNLTYSFSLGEILRSTSSNYGNGSNFTIAFAPNFTDETQFGNLSLLVYNPVYTYLNATYYWGAIINHTNYPVSLDSDIENESGTLSVDLTLSDYFTDFDIDDGINQTINFTLTCVSGDCQEVNDTITEEIINWTNSTSPHASFSSNSASLAVYFITADEYNESNSSEVLTNVTSNNFTINISETEVNSEEPQDVPSSGGGGGTTPIPVAFKLIAPGQVSMFYMERVDIPLQLKNTGKTVFNIVHLNSSGFKNGDVSDNVMTNLSLNDVQTLSAGDIIDFTLTVFLDTNQSGDYEIMVDANSLSPVYSDWATIKINIKEKNITKIEELLLFTEQFIVRNPECAEITEVLEEAKRYYEQGDLINSRLYAQMAIDACKEFISQKPVLLPQAPEKENYLYTVYLPIAVLISVMLGIIYYSVNRGRYIRKKYRAENQNKNEINGISIR